MPSHVRETSHLPTIGSGRGLAVVSGVGVDDCAVPESSDPQPAIRPPITSTITALDAMAILLADTNVPAGRQFHGVPDEVNGGTGRECCFRLAAQLSHVGASVLLGRN
jgi:hypothetical protein